MAVQSERHWLKGQPWPLENWPLVLSSHCITYLVCIRNFGLNSYWKYTSQDQYTCSRNQSWSCSKEGQGQPWIIIRMDLAHVGFTSPMLDYIRALAYLFQKIFEGFLPMDVGNHIGHVIRTIWTEFCSPTISSLHIKFKLKWPIGFRENVLKCLQTDRLHMLEPLAY